MSRWIDADALITELKDRWNKCDLGEFAENVWSVIDDAPSIDIVRCSECKYYEADWCYWSDEAITPDEFCSYGEREGD